MHKTPNPIPWLLVLFLLSAFQLDAQDIHFTQFARSPLNLNPALTGAFDGDYRFKGNFRNQWNSPVPYNTFSGSVERNFCTIKCDSLNCWRPQGFSVGALFNYDVAGDANLSLTQLELSGSYTTYLGKGFSFAGGLMVGGGQRSFDPVHLFFEAQFDGKQFDPNLSNLENYDREARFLFDLSLGGNFHYQSCKTRTNFDFGLGAFHVNRPKSNFYDDQDIKLPARFAVYAVGAIEVTDQFDLLINTLAQFQGSYQEILLGGGGRIHFSPKARSGGFLFDVGLGYRLDDAMVVTTEFHYKMWQLGISYDFNTSPFQVATDRNGGVEFALGYIISRPKPIKICPVQF